MNFKEQNWLTQVIVKFESSLYFESFFSTII